MSSLIFLRHGQAQNNVEQRLVGRMPNIPLTELGAQQARYAADYLSEMNISKIYSSPIQRTVQTAQIVSERCSVDIIQDDRLIEIDMAKFAGMKYQSMLQKYGNMFLKFYQGDALFDNDDTETFKSVQTRVADLVKDVLEMHPGENVVLVTHMDPIKAMLTSVINLTPDNLQNLIIANASINIFQVYQNQISLGGINIMAPSRFRHTW